VLPIVVDVPSESPAVVIAQGNLGAACRAPLTGASIMTTDSKRANQLLDLALRHARTIRVVIGELAKLNAERELRIITRQLADLTRRAEPAPHNTGDAP